MTGAARRWSLTDAVFLALIAASVLPVVLVRYPLSADYLNHLARLHILGSSPGAPVRQFYEIHWGLIPNLGVDLLWAILHPFASPETVMKGALIGAIVALGLSVWFLHRSLFERTQPTLLLCAFCLLSLPITAGLINFALGLPLTFLALGCWIRLGGEPSGKSLVLLNVLSVIAYFTHIAALGALGLTISAYHCLQQPINARAVLRRAAQLSPGFLAPAALIIVHAIADRHGGTTDSGVHIVFAATKLFTLLAAFFTGSTKADVAILCATGVIVILCRGPSAPRLPAVLLLWVVVIAAVPSSINDAVYVDARLAVVPVMLYLSSLAFRPALLSGPILALLTMSLAIGRVALLVPSLELHDAHVRSFRAIDDRVPRGARVLVAAVTRSGCGADHTWSLLEEHLPSLLAIDRDAFVTTVFAGAGMQPVLWKANMRGTARTDVIAPWLATLEGLVSAAGRAQLAQQSPDVFQSVESFQGWLEHYDYLAVRDCLPEQTPTPYLSLIARSDTYGLYRIVHPRPPPLNVYNPREATSH